MQKKMGYRSKQRILNRANSRQWWEFYKKCSTFLAIREMQIKTTLRFYLMPFRMAKTNKRSDSSSWPGCVVSRTFIHCLWEGKFVQPLWK